MKRKTAFRTKEFFRERKQDLIFVGVAAVLILAVIVLSVRYNGLREERQSRPEEYGVALEELNDARSRKNELESKIDSASQNLSNLKKKIAALSGN